MPRAAERIARAVGGGEPMVVYGDYDADGVTAASILLLGLRALGGEVTSYVPSRFVEGYGLNDAALERLASGGRRLVIAVDCGVTAHREIARARERRQDVIVVDHHEPGTQLPPALAVIDPKRADGTGGFREYAAAGLAFQLLRAVRRELRRPEIPQDLLGLAAVGTIADVVPLVGENRILARWGLAQLRADPGIGLSALINVAGVTGEISARHIAFALAPRLNAAGRMGDAAVAVRLLTTSDSAEAAGIAAQLDAVNQQRRALCDQILAQAVERVETSGLQDAPAIVLAGEGWHAGVVGIVASQLVERYYRPVVVMAVDGGVAKGSARSIEPFHLTHALAECADLLERFGGHAMAAGLTTTAARVPEFTRRFGEVASSRLRPDDLIPALAVDGEVTLESLTPALADQLQQLAPFGMGNPEPVFAARDLVAVTTHVMGDGQHLRLGITDGRAFAEAVGFRLGDASELLAFTRARIDLAFTVRLDRWEDRPRVQLMVEDLATPDLDLGEVLTDGRMLVDRLFARAGDYLGDGALGLEEAGAFHTKVAGVTFEGRQDVVRSLVPGDPLLLRREPDNPHDPHAVKVLTGSGAQVGFLSARVAARLAPSMDTGVRYAATVSQLTGGGDRSYGVNIHIQRHDGPADEPDPGGALRLAWRELPAADVIERVRVHLHRGRRLRDPQFAAIKAILDGRPIRGIFGPGRGRRAIIGIAAACWVISGRGPVVIAVPLQSQVDRWYERLAAGLREIGVRCARAHGALRFRARQHLLQALQAGSVDVVLASAEYLRAGTPPLRASLLLGDCDPTMENNPLEAAVHAPGVSQWGLFASSGGGPQPEHGEVITDAFLRVNLRLIDRRGTVDRDAALAAIVGRGEKTLIYAGTRAEAVAVAARLRDTTHGPVAYYHGGLPVRVREVVEQLFADGKISVLVASDGFTAEAAPADIRQAAVAGLPVHRGDFLEVIGSAGLDGRQATVTLLYRKEDLAATAVILDQDHPNRETLAAVYRVVREEVERAGAAQWPDETVRTALEAAGVSPRTAGIALDILAEAGAVQREYDGERWRITPAGQERRDLTTSLRYAEGRREAQALADVSRWAFGPLTDILKAVAGPTAGTTA